MPANPSLPSARLRHIQDDVPADSEIGNDEIVFYWDTTTDSLRARARINGDMKDVRPFDTALTATSAELNALDLSLLAEARTATAAGLTTGTIAGGKVINHITVTSADVNHIIILPAPTPGTIVILANGTTGYELRSSAPATVSINGGAGASAESAIAASTLVIAVCTGATKWQATGLAAATLAAVEAAA